MPRKPKAFKIIELAVGAHALRAPDLKKLKLEKKPEVSDEDRAKAISQLLKYTMQSGDTAQLINQNKIDRDALYHLFHTLETDGADYWVRGNYVPAVALGDAYVLSYLIEAQKRDMVNSLAINQILGYFDGITRRLLFPDEKEKLIAVTKKDGSKPKKGAPPKPSGAKQG